MTGKADIRVWIPGLLTIALLLLSIPTSLAASFLHDLDQLEQVITQTIHRLESEITLDQETKPDFARSAGLQFELSALAANRPDLLEEDYYHLALSLVARHFAQYELAGRLLQTELKAQKFRAARQWLRKEISEIEELMGSADKQTDNPLKQSRNYQVILQDLKETLAQAGVR